MGHLRNLLQQHANTVLRRMPKEVLQQAQAELTDWHGSGMSVMEMSHRGKEYMGIQADAEADLRELMGIPANYKVLFLQGGASMQFGGSATRPSQSGGNGLGLRQRRHVVF